MEIVYATVLGMGIGAVLRYVLPGRATYGILLLPAVGMIVSAALWSGATWLGWKPGGTWIWVVALGGAAVVSAAAALGMWRARTGLDRRRLHHLSGGHA